jgi:hypothetical protein
MPASLSCSCERDAETSTFYARAGILSISRAWRCSVCPGPRQYRIKFGNAVKALSTKEEPNACSWDSSLALEAEKSESARIPFSGNFQNGPETGSGVSTSAVLAWFQSAATVKSKVEVLDSAPFHFQEVGGRASSVFKIGDRCFTGSRRICVRHRCFDAWRRPWRTCLHVSPGSPQEPGLYRWFRYPRNRRSAVIGSYDDTAGIQS